jgi:hypothetical protein
VTGAGRPALRAVGGTGPGDAVIRRQRFEHAHPDITVTPPETHASMWIARQDGIIVASDYHLGGLLDALGWLTAERQGGAG